MLVFQIFVRADEPIGGGHLGRPSIRCHPAKCQRISKGTSIKTCLVVMRFICCDFEGASSFVCFPVQEILLRPATHTVRKVEIPSCEDRGYMTLFLPRLASITFFQFGLVESKLMRAVGKFAFHDDEVTITCYSKRRC